MLAFFHILNGTAFRFCRRPHSRLRRVAMRVRPYQILDDLGRLRGDCACCVVGDGLLNAVKSC